MSDGIDEVLLDIMVDNLTIQLNQLRGHGFIVGVDADNDRFVVLNSETMETTHYLEFYEDEETFDWKKVTDER